jgi:hypothetical protein
MVDNFIALGESLPSAPKIIISPHAGYRYSGPVAGKAYAAIDSAVRTVIILGPPHYVPVRGIAAPSVAWFETPLGRVAIDRDRVRTLLASPVAFTDDHAHESEHSLEVQLPFLQRRLSSFTIVPLLVSQVDPAQAAGCIFPLIDDSTLVVVSSDFSHYLTQAEARFEDDRSIAAILSGDAEGLIDACGELPIRIAMVLAGKMGLDPQLLDSRTSFDTSPDSGAGRVVGYASIALVPRRVSGRTDSSGDFPADSSRCMLTDEVKRYLLRLARLSLEASVKKEECPLPQDPPDAAGKHRGCFVTLTLKGELRGCIGYIEPIRPLFQAAMENTRNAALADPRFPGVTQEELPEIKIELSVLSQPTPLAYKDPADLLEKIVPQVDGIILQSGLLQATFLPQVWEQLPDRVQFLEHLSRKAGMARDGWKTSTVKRYRAEHFSE